MSEPKGRGGAWTEEHATREGAAQERPGGERGALSGTGNPQEAVLRGYDPFARAALEPFGFPADAHVALLSLSENATYRIDDPAASRTAVLRVHRTGYHPPGAVASELAWLQALRADEGLQTPAVYRAADGREVVDVTVGDLTRQTVLFEWLAGTEPHEDHLTEKFELLGEICARMHRHARAWRRPAGFVRFDWDFDCCVGDTPRWGRWQDGVGIGKQELIEHDPRVPELCDAWVRGYRRVMPLAEPDVAEIPTFVLLRRLQLVAWIGSHRFADAALELGAEFTAGCCEIADRYLSGVG